MNRFAFLSLSFTALTFSACGSNPNNSNRDEEYWFPYLADSLLSGDYQMFADHMLPLIQGCQEASDCELDEITDPFDCQPFYHGAYLSSKRKEWRSFKAKLEAAIDDADEQNLGPTCTPAVSRWIDISETRTPICLNSYCVSHVEQSPSATLSFRAEAVGSSINAATSSISIIGHTESSFEFTIKRATTNYTGTASGSEAQQLINALSAIQRAEVETFGPFSPISFERSAVKLFNFHLNGQEDFSSIEWLKIEEAVQILRNLLLSQITDPSAEVLEILESFENWSVGSSTPPL
jgi:hypothetical protein